MKLKEINTEVGFIVGRDGIFLDNINYDYGNRNLRLKGEINGLLASELMDDEFTEYSLEFKGVYVFDVVELDIYLKRVDMYWNPKAFAEIEESDLLTQAREARGEKLKGYFVQTYDDVLEIICESYEMKIYDSRKK